MSLSSLIPIAKKKDHSRLTIIARAAIRKGLEQREASKKAKADKESPPKSKPSAAMKQPQEYRRQTNSRCRRDQVRVSQLGKVPCQHQKGETSS